MYTRLMHSNCNKMSNDPQISEMCFLCSFYQHSSPSLYSRARLAGALTPRVPFSDTTLIPPPGSSCLAFPAFSFPKQSSVVFVRTTQLQLFDNTTLLIA